MRSGLLHRLRRIRRQVSDQHRHLKAIRADLLHALSTRNASAALKALRGYSQAIRAHFALENETFFPALHGLRPEFTGDLEALDREHARLLASLGRIEGSLAERAFASGEEEIEGFNAALADHEMREESLMARITGTFPEGTTGDDVNSTSS